MGVFKRYHELAGDVPTEIAESALIGRGTITAAERTNVIAGPSDADPHPVCVFTVSVRLDDTEPYTATCRQNVPTALLPEISTGTATVAVRVNPQDRSQIALALELEPPTVRLPEPPAGQSAAHLLATGRPARAVIVTFEPMGLRTHLGLDVYALTLTLMIDGEAPRQVVIGNGVPADAMPLLFAGSRVPVRLGPLDDDVVVDWDQALVEFTQSA